MPNNDVKAARHYHEATEHSPQMGIFARYKRSNKLPMKAPAASLKCRLGDAAAKMAKTTVTLTTNAAGQKEIAELQIAGEAFKHVF